MKLVEILIPTYNRASDLCQNLNHLKSEIEHHNLQGGVAILISDNASIDNTPQVAQDFVSSNSHLDVRYYRNKTNIGLERNVVNVFEAAQASYVLFCGDDDLIAPGYLSFCLRQMKEYKGKLGCVIPGLMGIDKSGTKKIGRIENYQFRELPPGYDSVYLYSHYAHQMSGLLLRTDGVLASYLKQTELRNPYLFIYFIAFNLYRYPSIYAPGFKTAVQTENEKAWGYNEIGLLDEVFKSYLYLEKVITKDQLDSLLVQFIRMHSYRLAIHPLKPIALIQKYKKVIGKLPYNSMLNRKIGLLFLKEYLLSFKRWN